MCREHQWERKRTPHKGSPRVHTSACVALNPSLAQAARHDLQKCAHKNNEMQVLHAHKAQSGQYRQLTRSQGLATDRHHTSTWPSTWELQAFPLVLAFPSAQIFVVVPEKVGGVLGKVVALGTFCSLDGCYVFQSHACTLGDA